MLQGEANEYKARDDVVRVDDKSQAAFDTSHLTDATSRLMNQAGTALHMLRLKVGAPVHLMLNIDKREGLVKGALAYVVHMGKHTVTIKLAPNKDNRRPVPNDTWVLSRLCFTFQPRKIPIKVNRYQIPLRLAWASTVHRVQGDDLKKVLVDLRHPFFAHGQLEVAISRGHDVGNTHYLVDPDDLHGDHFVCTNVVVPQVLWQDDLPTSTAQASPPSTAAMQQYGLLQEEEWGEWEVQQESSEWDRFSDSQPSEPSVFEYSQHAMDEEEADDMHASSSKP
jgi:PIF1-like helicase